MVHKEIIIFENSSAVNEINSLQSEILSNQNGYQESLCSKDSPQQNITSKSLEIDKLTLTLNPDWIH